MSFDLPWFRNRDMGHGPSIAEMAEAGTGVAEQAQIIPPASEALFEQDAEAAARRVVRERFEAARSKDPRRSLQPAPKQTRSELDELAAILDASDASDANAAPMFLLVPSAYNLQAFAAPWSVQPTGAKRDRFAIGVGGQGLFPVGCVSVFAGPGGVFKTSTAVLLCEHIAAGVPFAGLPVTRGSSLIVSLEEDAEDMGRRLGATAVTQFSAENLANIMSAVGLLAMPGQDGRFTEQVFKSVHASQMGPRLVEQARIHAKRTGIPVRMIVVDHARLATCGDVNDSEMVTALIRALNQVAQETGAAVVLLAHSPKSSLGPNREDEFSAADVLGSGAFVDNARFAAVVFPLTASERKKFGFDAEAARRYVGLRVIKSNFSESGRVFYMRKVPVDGWDIAVPEPVELSAPAPAKRADDALEERICMYVAARPGQFTPNQLAKNCAGSDGPLQAGRPAIKAAADRLIAAGRLCLRAPSPDEQAATGTTTRGQPALFTGHSEMAT